MANSHNHDDGLNDLKILLQKVMAEPISAGIKEVSDDVKKQIEDITKKIDRIVRLSDELKSELHKFSDIPEKIDDESKKTDEIRNTCNAIEGKFKFLDEKYLEIKQKIKEVQDAVEELNKNISFEISAAQRFNSESLNKLNFRLSEIEKSNSALSEELKFVHSDVVSELGKVISTDIKPLIDDNKKSLHDVNGSLIEMDRKYLPISKNIEDVLSLGRITASQMKWLIVISSGNFVGLIGMMLYLVMR